MWFYRLSSQTLVNLPHLRSETHREVFLYLEFPSLFGAAGLNLIAETSAKTVKQRSMAKYTSMSQSMTYTSPRLPTQIYRRIFRGGSRPSDKGGGEEVIEALR